ncbi:hypothetical protein QBC46DRAFT_412482 [Diplogelasinospora grovesii]|uniref:Uncharacterized protein n=1 Tax=Diplogelasinospora grovesii TaxID=303347 RepID=A0AAN6MYR6_9PEZI|nr:hypothetical protein QBC46DRAFT_412482 [Diplogelasinospora grovesii]
MVDHIVVSHGARSRLISLGPDSELHWDLRAISQSNGSDWKLVTCQELEEAKLGDFLAHPRAQRPEQQPHSEGKPTQIPISIAKKKWITGEEDPAPGGRRNRTSATSPRCLPGTWLQQKQWPGLMQRRTPHFHYVQFQWSLTDNDDGVVEENNEISSVRANRDPRIVDDLLAALYTATQPVLSKEVQDQIVSIMKTKGHEDVDWNLIWHGPP